LDVVNEPQNQKCFQFLVSICRVRIIFLDFDHELGLARLIGIVKYKVKKNSQHQRYDTQHKKNSNAPLSVMAE